MSTRNFQRTIENFVCEHCGAEVTGNGYTNHCPRCLWSKHVDIKPGDRSSDCHGPMRPVRIEVTGQRNLIHHRCETCGYEARVKASVDDDYTAILEVARGRAL